MYFMLFYILLRKFLVLLSLSPKKWFFLNWRTSSGIGVYSSFVLFSSILTIISFFLYTVFFFGLVSSSFSSILITFFVFIKRLVLFVKSSPRVAWTSFLYCDKSIFLFFFFLLSFLCLFLLIKSSSCFCFMIWSFTSDILISSTSSPL